MKRILSILLALIVAVSGVLAQTPRTKNLPNYDNKTWHFGFSLGTNNLGFNIQKADDFYESADVYGVEAIRHTGFHLGPLSNLRICNYLDLRMMFNLSFNQRDLVFHYVEPKGEGHQLAEHTMKMNSTMLEFPVLLKYKAQRMNNFSPYIVMGANFRYDLNGGDDTGDDSQLQLKKIDPCLEWGVGFDCYLQFFKFSVELKYGLGIMDTYKPNGSIYSNSIRGIRSNGWTLSLHFE